MLEAQAAVSHELGIGRDHEAALAQRGHAGLPGGRGARAVALQVVLGGGHDATDQDDPGPRGAGGDDGGGLDFLDGDADDVTTVSFEHLASSARFSGGWVWRTV